MIGQALGIQGAVCGVIELTNAVQSMNLDVLDHLIAATEHALPKLVPGSAEQKMTADGLARMLLVRQWVNQAKEQLMTPNEAAPVALQAFTDVMQYRGAREGGAR